MDFDKILDKRHSSRSFKERRASWPGRIGRIKKMYTVVEEYDLQKLIIKVNEMIKEGWKPIGGVCAYSHVCDCYLQTMIKDLP